MIRYYHDIEQGSEEWHALRCGIPTASEIRLIDHADAKAGQQRQGARTPL
jgi:hypothetical protein